MVRHRIAAVDVIPVRAADLRVEDGEVLAVAQFDLALTPPLEEALQKGIPLYIAIAKRCSSS